MSDWSLPPASRRVPIVIPEGAEALAVVWDEALGVAHVSHPYGLLLGSLEEVERWRTELFTKLAAIEARRGGRFPIVICVEGMTIRPAVAEEYGRVALSYQERFASGLARYNRRPNGVGQIITVAAMKAGYRANLFESKSAAVAHALALVDGIVSSRVR